MTGRAETRRVALEAQCGEGARGFPHETTKLPPSCTSFRSEVGHRDVWVGGGDHDRIPAEFGSSLANLSQRWTRRRTEASSSDHENRAV